jgi:hypothetical protein
MRCGQLERRCLHLQGSCRGRRPILDRFLGLEMVNSWGGEYGGLGKSPITLKRFPDFDSVQSPLT